MRRGAWSGTSVEGLVDEYRHAAAQQGKCIADGDAKSANRHSKRVVDSYREIRHRGSVAQAALLPLLDDPDPSVRAWAGAHSLEFAPSAPSPASSICREPGIDALSAETTLREWRRGTLRFP